MDRQKRYSLLLILTALIWGIAFVAQSTGGDAAGPYTFNCLRFLIAGVMLLPVIRIFRHVGVIPGQIRHPREKRVLFRGGICCGATLAAASICQQMGLYLGASAGKAGFLTSCYILLVPVFGLFLHKRCGWNVWLSIVIAAAGLYLLCMKGSFSLQYSDAMILLCACLFAVHILTVDYFASKTDGVRMACIQFFVCGLVSGVPMLLTETAGGMGVSKWLVSLSAPAAWISILYAGVLSSGVGYTLQIIGQKEVDPTVASLLMSLESVFSVLAGAVLLGESLSGREIAGCILIFGAILFAQLPKTTIP